MRGTDPSPGAQAELSPAKRELLERWRRGAFAGPAARPAVPPRPEGAAPLSFAQERLWSLEQLKPGTAAYNIPFAVRLDGPLDHAALGDGLDALVRRHEALRTTFEAVEGQPRQVVGPPGAVPLPTADLRELPEAEREAEARRLADEEARRPFDLARGPLFRARLLRLGPDAHVLMLTMHHIVSDGWSVGVLAHELGALYAAFSRGRPSPLPPLPIQYADYAAWQRERLRGEALEQQLAYWRRQLEASPPVLELPTARPRPPVQSYRGARHAFTLPPDLAEALRALSRREGATLYMTLLAAFQALLGRYTGRDDVLVGSPVAGRTRTELEGLIGFFVNTLVLRADLAGDPSFRELLGRVREAALGAFAHQDLPFEKLVEALRPPRERSRAPLVQVLFALQNAPRKALELAGLDASPLEVESGTAKFDLSLSLRERADGLDGSFSYSTDLFDAATIERLAGHYRTLLEGLAADPDWRLSELPLLPQAERRQILVEWNATAAAFPRDRCVHELFEEQAERAPEAVAVVRGSRQLTYRELDRRANRLARQLRELGIGAEVPVGLCLERSPELVVGMLGVLKAGGAYVPLDPSYPRGRLAFMLEDARAPVLLTRERLLATLPTGYTGRVVCLDSAPELLSAEVDEDLAGGTGPGNAAYVMYTSGSTGRPKGVVVPHRAIGRLVCNADYARLDATDVVAQASSCAFDAATFEIWGALLNGARLVLVGEDALLSPRDFAAHLERHGITTLFLTTALFNDLAREAPAAFGRLRGLLFGGEAADPRRVREVLAHGPPERLLHVYGPTETTTFATWSLVREVAPDATTVPIGRPIANTVVYLLDPHLQPVPVGVPGELYIGGPGLARGYLNLPELTAERFVPDPFGAEPGARLYRTGDLARYRPDGQIEFLGRLDHQVKLRGFRIELGEVEAALTRHPGVREAAAAVREDEPGDKRLVAYVVPTEDVAPPVTELRAFLREQLPPYMLPAAIVALRTLPLGPNGKVDRSALPRPPTARPAADDGPVPPETDCERELVRIWERLLDVRPIGVTDNFFDLGGHSLLAARMFAEIDRVLGRQLALSSLLPEATIRHLAGVIAGDEPPAPQSCLVPIQPAGSRPPFFCAVGLGGGVLRYARLARHLGQDQPLYALAANLDECPSIEALAARYVDELRAFRPVGPYLLGGYCLGGIVAYEMARQLAAAGGDVALLALVDATLPGSGDGRVRVTPDSLIGFVRNLPIWLGEFLRLGPERMLARGRRRLRRASRRIASPVGKGAESWRTSLGDLLDAAPHLTEDRLRLIERQYRAALDYRPKPYPGRVTLFRARRQRLLSSFNPELGWGALAGGGVEVHVVPGNHAQMIVDEPYAGTFARHLESCLESALEARSR